MANRIQMSILELSRVLQSVSKHAVETDVSDPDKREQQHGVANGRERITGQGKGTNICVDAL